MVQPSTTRKRRLGEILMDAGLLTELQLNAALSEQRKWGGKLGRTLVEMGFVDEQSMAVALSRQLQLPVVDLDEMEVAADAVQFLRVDLAERYGVFPIAGDRRHKSVTIASSDPTNVEQLQELSFLTGLRVQVAVASASSIDRAIRRYYYGDASVSTETMTPANLGVSEPEYDLAPGGALPNGYAGASGAGGRDVIAELDRLHQRVTDLERLMRGEVRALRGIVELLLEKGVFSREEYLGKVRKD